MGSNYPAGAEFDSRAPYNQQRGQNIEEISVWASNTLSKNVVLEVENCGNAYEQISQLYRDQHYTAKEALSAAAKFAKKLCIDSRIPKEIKEVATKVANACEGWEEDEFEVVLN